MPKFSPISVGIAVGVLLFCAGTYQPALSQSGRSIDDHRDALDNALDSRWKAFDAKITQRRRAFDQLIRQRWEEFDAQIAKDRFVRPKLTALPTFQASPAVVPRPQIEPNPVPVRAKPPVIAPTKPRLEDRPQKPQEKRQKSPASPAPQAPPAAVPSETELRTEATFTLSFFGENLAFAGDNEKRVGGDVEASLDLVRDQSGLSRYWRTSNDAERRLVSDLKRHTRQLKLDDWMTYQLVRQLSKALVPDRNDTRVALAWKLLNRIGFDVRVAKRSGRLLLLVPIAQQVYGTSYITIEGQKFYALDTAKSKNRFSTYPGVASDRRILSRFSPGKVFWQSTEHRVKQTLRARKGSASYALDLQYSPRDVASLASYPQFDFGFYFKNPTRALLDQDVRFQLTKYTDSDREMGEILLRLVQLGLTYKTDQEQFGKENYLFGDETLSYAIGDCEDRSILYAGLIKKHLGIDYVVLLYPGHLAVALDMPGDGDQVTHNGKRYLVADPTYMRAPIGYEMKQYRNRGRVIYASKDN